MTGTVTVKKLIILAALCGSVYFFGSGQDTPGSGNDEAVATYKSFMDRWITLDYERAEPYVVGDAASKVHGAQEKALLDMKGTVEASRVKVVSQTESSGRLNLEILYSASISWPGVTANPNSPKTWKQYEQKASMVQDASGWKVASFSVN